MSGEVMQIMAEAYAEAEAKVAEINRKEGEAKGRAEGEAKGRAEGRAEGEAKGRAIGRADAVRSFVAYLLEKNTAESEICAVCKITPDEFQQICKELKASA